MSGSQKLPMLEFYGFHLFLKDETWNWLNNNNKVMVNWADDQPDIDAPTLVCTKINLPSGLWYSSTCDVTLPYVCETPPGKQTNTHARRLSHTRTHTNTHTFTFEMHRQMYYRQTTKVKTTYLKSPNANECIPL